MTIELTKEPKLSFIVPIYKNDKASFKRCLMNLDDQDYPNIEIICVFDGIDPQLVNVAVPFLKNGKFKILETEHGGAPAARNRGFRASSGDIVSFFNSDYEAKPGMARMWVDELLKHPDCGFLYGPYEYATRDRVWYGSKPFDPWQLEQANYIDCGFPIWRKHVIEWDENCESLQDWDFWLRVVRNGVKGHFLDREISFIAAPPKEGGLSLDSHYNWIERVKYIKNKNGIKTSSLVVTSVGAVNHGVQIAQMLGADYRDDTIFKPHEYKSIYMIGFFIKPQDEGNQHPQVLAHFDKVIKIVHFIGADIYWLKKFSFEQLKYISGALNLKCKHILCETHFAQKELAEMGIKSEVVPIPPYQDYEIKPLPNGFRVGVFLTDKSDFDKYCQEETLSIIRSCPDIQFTAYGDGGKDEKYPNLIHVGNLSKEEWRKFVYDHSCYFRLVRHDTRPMASDEFILAGRDVLTNIRMPYMLYIDTTGDDQLNEWDVFGTGLNTYRWPATKSDIVRKLRTLHDYHLNHNDGTIESDRYKAHEFYAGVLNRDKYISIIKEMAEV